MGSEPGDVEELVPGSDLLLELDGAACRIHRLDRDQAGGPVMQEVQLGPGDVRPLGEVTLGELEAGPAVRTGCHHPRPALPREAGARHSLALHEELPVAGTRGVVRPGSVGLDAPVLQDPPSAPDDPRAGRGGPGHRRPLTSAIPGPELQGAPEGPDALGEDDLHVPVRPLREGAANVLEGLVQAGAALPGRNLEHEHVTGRARHDASSDEGTAKQAQDPPQGGHGGQDRAGRGPA